MSMPKNDNVHHGHRSRTRDRVEVNGPESLLDHEMLEMLLYFVIPRCDTNPIAHRLMERFGSFDKVIDASVPELLGIEGIGKSAAMLFPILADVVRRYLLAQKASAGKQKPMTPDHLFECIYPHFIGRQKEQLYLMSLNNAGTVIDTVLISEGIVNRVSIDTRAIVQHALNVGASSVVLFHNHPSGTPEPSLEDVKFTNEVSDILERINIYVKDHLVIAGASYSSVFASPLMLSCIQTHTPPRRQAHLRSPLPCAYIHPESNTYTMENTIMDYPVFDAHMHPYIDDNENICGYPLPVKPEEIGADLARIGITRFAGSVVAREFRDFDTIRTLNRHALQLRDMYVDKYVPGIHIHPDYVKESCEELKIMYDQGVRLIGELVPYMMGWKEYTCPGAMEIFTYAQELGMTVSIHPTTEEDMLKLYKSFPHMNFIAAHPGEKARYMAHLESMEACPNVYLDICGTGLFRYGMLSYGVSRVGSERFLFGTDFPTCTPGMQVSGVLYERMSNADYENILYKNAERLLLGK
ncbi:MAG: hypothetical protein E7463_14110 [Ruminococcaceae bacterium]|nr:hypothetical protein [Oscillospiraceae bacterium]